MKVYYKAVSQSNWDWVQELKNASPDYLPAVKQTQAMLKKQGIETELLPVDDKYTLAMDR